MRFAPKSYMFEIIKSGGFGLLFEEQIYPWGHGALLKEAREHLLLKVQCPRDVKEGDMQRLLNWHAKRLATQWAICIQGVICNLFAISCLIFSSREFDSKFTGIRP